MKIPLNYNVSLMLPEPATHAYREAALILERRIGRQAPTAEQLILHELTGRTPQAIAEEYLVRIGWYERSEGRFSKKGLRPLRQRTRQAPVR